MATKIWTDLLVRGTWHIHAHPQRAELLARNSLRTGLLSYTNCWRATKECQMLQRINHQPQSRFASTYPMNVEHLRSLNSVFPKNVLPPCSSACAGQWDHSTKFIKGRKSQFVHVSNIWHLLRSPRAWWSKHGDHSSRTLGCLMGISTGNPCFDHQLKRVPKSGKSTISGRISRKNGDTMRRSLSKLKPLRTSGKENLDCACRPW